MAGIFFSTIAIGQFPTLLIFVGLYLKYWGNFGWKIIALYVLGSAAFLLIMFNEIVPVLWHEPEYLPSFFL